MVNWFLEFKNSLFVSLLLLLKVDIHPVKCRVALKDGPSTIRTHISQNQFMIKATESTGNSRGSCGIPSTVILVSISNVNL